MADAGAAHGNGRETAALTERVESNRRELADFRGETKEAIAELRGELRNAGKTNWTTIAAFIGIALTIATLLGGVFAGFRMMDVARLDKLEAFASANIVTRSEHDALNRERAALLEVQTNRVDQLRVDVNGLAQSIANIVNVRDYVLDLKEENRRQSDEIDQLRSSRVSGAQ